MNVPFLASCGHLFCYECLTLWFENKLNCPTCRADLETAPILNVALRDIASSVMTLLIDTTTDETEKQLLISRREDNIQVYTEDLEKKRLFGHAFDLALTLIDKSDGVPRCGNCHWEAHGSVCLQCGVRFRIARDDDYYDSADAYDEDSDEQRLYGDEDAYDTGDSFVDGRDIWEISHDLDVSQDILSDSNESWRGFDGYLNLLDSDGSGLFDALRRPRRHFVIAVDDDSPPPDSSQQTPMVINVSDEDE